MRKTFEIISFIVVLVCMIAGFTITTMMSKADIKDLKEEIDKIKVKEKITEHFYHDSLVVQNNYHDSIIVKYHSDSIVIIERYHSPDIDSSLDDLNIKVDLLSLRIQDYVNDTNWFDTTIVHINWKDSIRYITRKTYHNILTSDNGIYYMLHEPRYKLRSSVSNLTHSSITIYRDTTLINPLKGYMRIINKDTSDYTGNAFYTVTVMDPDYNIILDTAINIPPIAAKGQREVPWISDIVLPIGKYIYSYVIYAGSNYFPIQGHAGYFNIRKYEKKLY